MNTKGKYIKQDLQVKKKSGRLGAKRVRALPPNTVPCPDYDLWTPSIITPGGVFQLMRYAHSRHVRTVRL